jgi:mannosyl-3-phosphoglycerate phosphatase
MDVIFTDLDGTLLDRDTYSWQAAGHALESLRRRGTPWVLVTSKTRAEVEFWRHGLKNRHPFIVENGGAACIPLGYFPTAVAGARRLSPYEVMEWGSPYETLVEDLQACSRESRCPVRGFHDMTACEIAALADMPLEQALLARQREYDEPFLVLDPHRADALTGAIEERGRRWTRGGRFWHILGDHDKAAAVKEIARLFAEWNAPIRTIGLGDGLNDASFLNCVMVPVLIRSAQTGELKARVPSGVVTDRVGPRGWNDAVLALIGE